MHKLYVTCSRAGVAGRSGSNRGGRCHWHFPHILGLMSFSFYCPLSSQCKSITSVSNRQECVAVSAIVCVCVCICLYGEPVNRETGESTREKANG